MDDRKGWNPLWLGGAILLLLLPFPFLGDLRERIVPSVCLMVGATLVLYFSLPILRRKFESVRPRHVLLVALLLRAAVFPLQPSLSDDAWRYLWDGRLVANGINPYHHVPSDSVLADYHDELYALQGYPETNTIYPPVAQLIFAAAASFDANPGSDPALPYVLYKLLLVAADLGAIWLLLRILARLRLPASGAILYAWHPLVVVELAGQGHTDVFWVLALGLAIYGFLFRRAGEGMPALAFGVGTRLFPLFAMPVWLRFIEKKKRPAALLLSLPVLLLLYPLLDPEAFNRYSTVAARFTNFYEFNGGIYYGVKAILDSLSVSPSNTLAGGVTTALMLLGVAAITLWPIGRRTLSALLARVLGIATMQIAFSAKVHIWYFVVPLYLLALWPDRRFIRAWLWVALVAPMTYLSYATEPFRERTWVLAIEWGGFAVLLLSAWYRKEKGGRRTGTGKRETPDS